MPTPINFSSLAEILPPARLRTDPVEMTLYGFDGTAALQSEAGAVVFPETTEEVAKLVRWCRDREVPLVTRGSGTGLSGGSVPPVGALVLCTVRMNRILEVDTANLTLLAETGTITAKVDEAARQHGLFYPPDPGSMKISTIGGNVAENSGGLRGLKYGVTRDYVMGLEVVLPDGEVVFLGNKCVKDVAGYSMKDLFIGSEGTLGIITKVLLKLLPIPTARKTLLAEFPSMAAAAETVSQIIARQIIPCTLEFLDQATIRCVEDFARLGLPVDAAAILLMETDGHPAAVEEEAAAMADIARSQGASRVTVAASAAEADALAQARRSAFSALARVRPTTILEDVTVPRSKLAEMVQSVQEVAERFNLRVATFGHFGDGNLHPTFLTDERDKEEMHRVEQAMEIIFDKAIALGGTITGEHGVGLAKKAFLPRQAGDVSLQLMRLFKRSIDPLNLLNPGNMFDA
jgi:glycolate oxidase